MSARHREIGVGATAELSLRVSVATLVRVLFKNPEGDELMLALERKATLRETESGRVVEVRCQPFGGAIRIFDLTTIGDLLGDFRFDSERTRAEQDFRILIRPSAWPLLREFCLEHINRDDDHVLETNPGRELVEEFGDTLKINLRPEQYICESVSTILEDEASRTDNIHARGIPTVRIYRIFEALIVDSFLAQAMAKNSQGLSSEDLCELALADARNGGRGRANAILALSWGELNDAYREMSASARNTSVMFDRNQLNRTVSAVLDGITVPRYQNVG
jgi:hypothetical protein